MPRPSVIPETAVASTTGARTTASSPATWPTSGLCFGGDYNPEQWSPPVWREDIALMKQAGVTIVTLGVFSWGLLERADGEFDADWLEEVIDLLHEADIAVDLATPTAAPPSWLLTAHPEIMPRDIWLHPEPPGGRLGWCPSSPVFRRLALRIVRRLAERFGHHPAVRMWHVSNELGGGNARCYCDVSAARFREWLRERYGTVDALNQSWGSAFWGHTFGGFEEVLPPRGHRDAANPGRFLDFERFSSDELLAHYEAERSVLRSLSAAPITTNLMVGAGGGVADYARWAPRLDIVTNDHYTIVTDPDRAEDLSLSADRVRGLSAGRGSWLLLEHSTGAPSWQRRNRAKDPGEILRNSLAHVARGSDGAMFFQWRASTAGAEQFHSAMLPHAGTNTRVWREIVELGRILGELDDLAGCPVEPARVAMVVDYEAAWALEQGLKPHRDLHYATEVRRWYAQLWRRQVLVDVLPSGSDLSGYDLLLVPTLFLVSDATARSITEFVRRGGTALVTYLSGIVDETNRVRPGPYPGAFRELLGVWTEEFRPLQEGEEVRLEDGSLVAEWTEDTVLAGADAVLRFADGASAGRPAVTRHRLGAGTAWYVAAQLTPETCSSIVTDLLDHTGIEPGPSLAGVEIVRRVTPSGTVAFVLNHTPTPVEVDICGFDVVTATTVNPLRLAAGAVAVVRETS